MLDRNSLAYKRYQRHRAISRKKAICNSHQRPSINEKTHKSDFSKYVPFNFYRIDGMYDKGKIHCSCGICKFSKKFGLPTLRTQKELLKFKQDLNEANLHIG